MGLSNLIGQVLDEKYLIEKRLGEGGMGSVYLATHVGTDRPVALKVITPQFMNHDEFVERFRREAKAAGRLRHPNVVNVTDFGIANVGADEIAYLVMEYLDGCTLADILAEESRLSLDWVVDILEQACSAVDEAHQQGIIHRDLKPDNIWLEPNRRGGYRVKVLDFGLAKLADSPMHEQESTGELNSADKTSLTGIKSRLQAATDEKSEANETATLMLPPDAEAETQTRILDPAPAENADQLKIEEAKTRIQQPDVFEEDGTRILDHNTVNDGRHTASADGLTRVGSILGTPLYMSPEQCGGGALTASSDVYSLGVIAYQMLSGETPFAGDMNEVMRHHLESPPPPLREKNRKMPKKVAALVMSALAKNPDERPASAAAFASALRAKSEGAGAVLRKAFALLGERFPTFFRISVLVSLPLIIISSLQLLFAILARANVISSRAGLIGSIVFALLSFIVTLFTGAIIGGVTVRVVTQLIVAPLRPIRLSAAFGALRKRLKPFLTTVIGVSLLSILGIILCVIPGIIFMIHYSLVSAVLMMEDKRGWAAMKRAKTLARRAMRSVVMIVFIQFGIPFFTSLIASLVINLIADKFGVKQGSDIVRGISEFIRTGMSLFIVPMIAIMSSLLYIKTRQAGGETLSEALGQFEEEEATERKWQLRMRERLHLKSSRATSGASALSRSAREVDISTAKD